MKKRMLALLMAVCLLAALLAGCGSQAAQSASAPAQEASSAAAPESQAPAPEPEPEPAPEAPVQEPESAVEEIAAPQYAPYEWPLPLTEEDVTFTVSMMINPQLANYYAGYEDNPAWQEYSKLTGVNFQFQNISAMNIGEQYNLMFASQDYPNIMHSGLSYYSTGADAAVNDDVILDLTPYLEEYAPNYLYMPYTIEELKRITCFRMPAVCVLSRLGNSFRSKTSEHFNFLANYQRYTELLCSCLWLHRPFLCMDHTDGRYSRAPGSL